MLSILACRSSIFQDTFKIPDYAFCQLGRHWPDDLLPQFHFKCRKTIPIKLFPDETSKCWSHSTPSNCLLGDGARVEINVFHWLVDVGQLPPVLGLVFLRHSWPRAQPLHSTPLAKLVVRGKPVFTAPLDVNSQQIFTEVFVLAGKQKSNEAFLCFWDD